MPTKTSQIMAKKMITEKVETPVSEAMLFMKAKRIRHLPIVNSEREIVGIVSQRDFNIVGQFPDLRVKHIMTSPLESVHQDLDLRSTILKMLEKKISSLIVVDDDKEAVGIITTDDLLWHLAELIKKDVPDKGFLGSDKLQTIGRVLHQIAQTGI